MSDAAEPWCWVAPRTVRAIHDRVITEHGGTAGVRDAGLIESALARPQHLAAYEAPDAADLAAAYAHGLAKNHGFIDGNKRVAWTVARLFLADNGWTLRFSAPEAVVVMERLAAGLVSQAEFAQWLRDHLSR